MATSKLIGLLGGPLGSPYPLEVDIPEVAPVGKEIITFDQNVVMSFILSETVADDFASAGTINEEREFTLTLDRIKEFDLER